MTRPNIEAIWSDDGNGETGPMPHIVGYTGVTPLGRIIVGIADAASEEEYYTWMQGPRPADDREWLAAARAHEAYTESMRGNADDETEHEFWTRLGAVPNSYRW